MNMEEYLPLREVVFYTLRESILKGELQPGERLMEVALAEKLGVSRTPIREAIRKLELEGLVTMIPRKGAQVARISEKNVRDVLEVRKALECLAVDLAMERILPEEREALKEAAIAFARSMSDPDLRVIAQRDEQFHDVIYAATKNEKLQLIVNNLREQMYRFRLEYIKDAQMRKTIAEEHRLITKSILAGNAEHARDISRIHIDNQEATILKNLSREREPDEVSEAEE